MSSFFSYLKYLLLILSIPIFALVLAYLFQNSSLEASKPNRWTPKLGRGPLPGEEFVNPADGSVLVWIPGGSFTMGANNSAPDEKPAHKLKVKGFWLGKYEVTNKQYKKFVKANDYWEPDFFDDATLNAPGQPVVAIKWNHAKAYVKWADLRMPTEAEWEYAARGGKQLEYGTRSGSASHNLANYWGKAGRDKWLEKTAPVGSFPPNPYGIYDMGGNAWEWTSSLYWKYPYSATDGRENLTTKNFRVMRGGCWHFSAKYMKNTHRHKLRMHLRLDYAGIRVALSRVPGQK